MKYFTRDRALDTGCKTPGYRSRQRAAATCLPPGTRHPVGADHVARGVTFQSQVGPLRHWEFSGAGIIRSTPGAFQRNASRKRRPSLQNPLAGRFLEARGVRVEILGFDEKVRQRSRFPKADAWLAPSSCLSGSDCARRFSRAYCPIATPATVVPRPSSGLNGKRIAWKTYPMRAQKAGGTYTISPSMSTMFVL